jgi:flagellar M-ring protein FliF
MAEPATGLALIDRIDSGGLQTRARSLFDNPAVQRARPALIAGAIALLLAVLWLGMRSPDWRPLYGDMSDGDKSAVLAALQAGNYTSRINPDSGSVEVASDDIAAARILLAGQGLPKSATPLDPVGNMPLGLSRAVESARLKSAVAIELAASIKAIDGVRQASVQIAMPEPSVFVRDKVPASASVFVTLAPGRTLSEAQVRAIVWLVSSSVAGLAADKVSVVDQSGALLSSGGSAAEAAQLGYQGKVEAMVRERLVKLLTPLIGLGRFTAEVAADVDYSENEATSERYAPDGSVLRSESASRSNDPGQAPARGVPGALSNTAPAGAQLTGIPPAGAPAAPAAPPPVTSETTNRAWEIGRDISVTRAGAPRLRRLSVAVVIDKAALAKATPQDIAAITRIVRGAIGYDAARGDQVEVQLRSFAPLPAEPAVPWFRAPAVADNAPYVAIAILVVGGGIVLLLLRRRKAVAATAVSTTGGAAAPGAGGAVAGRDGDVLATIPDSLAPLIDGGMLTPAGAMQLVDYSAKLGTTRSLVNDDADRATAVARQMLAAT